MLLHDVDTSFAGFAQASYALTDALTATGGERVTRDTKTTNLLLHPNFATRIAGLAADTPTARC